MTKKKPTAGRVSLDLVLHGKGQKLLKRTGGMEVIVNMSLKIFPKFLLV